jgi:hypothetical protein
VPSDPAAAAPSAQPALLGGVDPGAAAKAGLDAVKAVVPSNPAAAAQPALLGGVDPGAAAKAGPEAVGIGAADTLAETGRGMVDIDFGLIGVQVSAPSVDCVHSEVSP